MNNVPALAGEAQSHVVRGGHGAGFNRCTWCQQGNQLQRMHFSSAIPVNLSVSFSL